VKHLSALTFGLLAATLSFSITARADSDGYFCVSKGYLAYELRQGLTAGVVGHELKLVKVGPERGIYLASEATLLDFQVYHLICSENGVEISGWNKVFTKYVIDVQPSGEMKVSSPLEYPDVGWRDAAKDGPEPLSLNLFGPKADPVSVESLDIEHQYQLLPSVSGKESKDGFEWHIKSELIKIDKTGNVLQRLVLYERVRIEPRD